MAIANAVLTGRCHPPRSGSAEAKAQAGTTYQVRKPTASACLMSPSPVMTKFVALKLARTSTVAEPQVGSPWNALSAVSCFCPGVDVETGRDMQRVWGAQGFHLIPARCMVAH